MPDLIQLLVFPRRRWATQAAAAAWAEERSYAPISWAEGPKSFRATLELAEAPLHIRPWALEPPLAEPTLEAADVLALGGPTPQPSQRHARRPRERHLERAGLELRQASGGPSRIEGYAAVYDEETELWEGMSEVIRPGAFARTLGQGADVRALWNHDPSAILGRTRSKTLELRGDERGLWYSVEPGATTWGQDAVVAVGRGDVDGSSFGFRVIRDRYEKRSGGDVLRELLEVALFDVSPTAFPAYEGTAAGVRSRFGEAAPPELRAEKLGAVSAGFRSHGLTELDASLMLAALEGPEDPDPDSDGTAEIAIRHRARRRRLELLAAT